MGYGITVLMSPYVGKCSCDEWAQLEKFQNKTFRLPLPVFVFLQDYSSKIFTVVKDSDGVGGVVVCKDLLLDLAQKYEDWNEIQKELKKILKSALTRWRKYEYYDKEFEPRLWECLEAIINFDVTVFRLG